VQEIETSVWVWWGRELQETVWGQGEMQFSLLILQPLQQATKLTQAVQELASISTLIQVSIS